MPLEQDFTMLILTWEQRIILSLQNQFRWDVTLHHWSYDCLIISTEKKMWFKARLSPCKLQSVHVCKTEERIVILIKCYLIVFEWPETYITKKQ